MYRESFTRCWSVSSQQSDSQCHFFNRITFDRWRNVARVWNKNHIKQIMLSNIKVYHFHSFVGWQTVAPFILTFIVWCISIKIRYQLHIFSGLLLWIIFFIQNHMVSIIWSFFFFVETTDSELLIADNMTRYDDHNNETKGNVTRKKQSVSRLMVLLTISSLYYVIRMHSWCNIYQFFSE